MDAQRLARVSLGAASAAFAGPGLGFLLRPDVFTAAVDLAPLGTTGLADARAVMGGLEVGIACVLAACALRPASLRAGLALQLVLLGGLLVGRATSLARDGAPGALGWLLAAIELLLFAAGALALARLGAARSGPPQPAPPS